MKNFFTFLSLFLTGDVAARRREDLCLASLVE